jgi:hypothetical protein
LSRNQRLVLVGLAAVVLVVAFVVARSGSEDEGNQAAQTQTQTQTQPTETTPADTTPTETETTPARPATPTVVVRDGQPVNGVRDLEFEKGDQVAFNVRADTPQQIHVHGYDIFRNAAPGQVARFRFAARFEGRFEVELEGPHTQIAEIEVQP